MTNADEAEGGAEEMSFAESCARMADGGDSAPLPGRLNMADDRVRRAPVEVVAGPEMLQRIERRAFAPIMSALHRALVAAEREGSRYLELHHVIDAVRSLRPLRAADAERWRWQSVPTGRLNGREREASENDDIARFIMWRIRYEAQRDESIVIEGCATLAERVWLLWGDTLQIMKGAFPGRVGELREKAPR